MKSFKKQFDKFVKKYPNWSSYLCFAEVLRHHKYTREKIKYWFNKLVDPDDYAREEKKQIIDYLANMSNPES